MPHAVSPNQSPTSEDVAVHSTAIEPHSTPENLPSSPPLDTAAAQEASSKGLEDMFDDDDEDDEFSSSAPQENNVNAAIKPMYRASSSVVDCVNRRQQGPSCWQILRPRNPQSLLSAIVSFPVSVSMAESLAFTLERLWTPRIRVHTLRRCWRHLPPLSVMALGRPVRYTVKLQRTAK